MTVSTKNAPEFEEIEKLLPWHAAGTLDPDEAARVETALTEDRELARRFELAREELAETVTLNEALGVPSAGARDRLFAMIDQEPQRKPSAIARLATGFTIFMASLRPRTLAYGATAAALALVLQAGLLAGFLFNEQPVSHQLASAPTAAAIVEGSHVLIRFNPQASVGEITGFLGDHDAVVVDGPVAGGMFRLRVADTTLPQDELAALVKRMGQSPIVGMALPAASQ